MTTPTKPAALLATRIIHRCWNRVEGDEMPVDAMQLDQTWMFPVFGSDTLEHLREEITAEIDAAARAAREEERAPMGCGHAAANIGKPDDPSGILPVTCLACAHEARVRRQAADYLREVIKLANAESVLASLLAVADSIEHGDYKKEG